MKTRIFWIFMFIFNHIKCFEFNFWSSSIKLNKMKILKQNCSTYYIIIKLVLCAAIPDNLWVSPQNHMSFYILRLPKMEIRAQTDKISHFEFLFTSLFFRLRVWIQSLLSCRIGLHLGNMNFKTELSEK